MINNKIADSHNLFIFCSGKTSREKKDPTQNSTKVNIYIYIQGPIT